MILRINDALTISEIQDKFHDCFPHLKIEFYNGLHALKNNKPADGHLHIKDISKKNKYGEVLIKSLDSAGGVSHNLKSEYGILTRIFRLEEQKFIPLKNDELLKAGASNSNKGSADFASDDDEEEVRLFI